MTDKKKNSCLKDDKNSDEIEKKIVDFSYNPVKPSKNNDTPLPPNEK